MLGFSTLLVLATGLGDVLASPVQVALQAPSKKPRSLHGRFLQISDMHPDPHYLVHTSEKTACHRKKGKKSKNQSKFYGTPYSECDSPFTLTNFTLDYLDKEWTSEVDFVIWTGDNARHDNDPKTPRTTDEIYDLNRAIAAKMKEVFTNKGIPVVPSLGNNDVWPHVRDNYPVLMLSLAESFFLPEYLDTRIWDKFIPFPYLQVFQRGAYYSVEVIPDEVAAISLNTMYFYDSNKAVGGCGFHDRDDPGNLQLDWLEVQLKTYRYRNMQVYISGHVPPSPGNYFPDCYVRYVELALRFQDTILGHLYGHMNVDHFTFLEAIDLEFTKDDKSEDIHMQRTSLYETLMEEYAAIPTKAKELDYAEYAVVNTAPPVVPNPFLPSFRVFAYNLTEGESVPKISKDRSHGHKRGDRNNKEVHCREEENRDTWKCFLNNTWYSDPESPSRTNTRWTPLGYAQYNLPDLEDGTKSHKPHYKLEYLTFAPHRLHPNGTDSSTFRYPIPLAHLPKSLRNASVAESKYAPYSLADLTIPSWVGLAQRLGDKKENKLRRLFRKYMYMGSETE